MDTGHENADNELKRLEKRLRSEYSKAYKTANNRLTDYLKKFEARDNEKRALLSSGKITRDEYKQWRLNQMCTGEVYAGIRDVLAKDLSNANQIAMGMINDSTKGVYADNVNYGMYEVESGMHMATSFTLYDKYTVENLMKKDPNIIPQARLDIPKDLRWNRKKINSAITQGILSGESIPNIAKRLQSVTDMNKKAAIRNARTYTTAAENKGRVDSYEHAKSLGIQMQQEWLATVDMRTRTSHRHLDGERVDVGGTFSNGCKFPGDPSGRPEEIYNCRCTLIAAIKGLPDDSEDRFMRLPKGMTYEEWKNGRDKYTEQESFIGSLSKDKLSPHISEYRDVHQYWDSKQEWKKLHGDFTRYIEDLNYENKNIRFDAAWSGDKNTKIPKIESIIVKLNDQYPLPQTKREYGTKVNEFIVCDYSRAWEFLPNGQTDRRLDDSAAAQVFQNENQIVMAFRRNEIMTTLEDDLKARERAITSGGMLSTIGDSIESVTIHEYGHVMSDHFGNAMIYEDETAVDYWNWYKGLTKDDIRKGLSDYATANRSEFEAECFLELQMPNPRPMALKFKEYLDEVIKKGY